MEVRTGQFASIFRLLTPQQQDEYLPQLKTIADPLYWLTRMTKTKDEQQEEKARRERTHND